MDRAAGELMQKPLPPATWAALSPPANDSFPYTFFADGAQHPFQPQDTRLNLRNAWWLMDAAFLCYSDNATVTRTWQRTVADVDVRCFSRKGTHCYVAASAQWIILAWRGTQVDDLWASALDWLTDARFFPARDADGHLVHSGFLDATADVWEDVRTHVQAIQNKGRRALWNTGHSLGAALATIAANRCSHQPALGLAGTYTYGSPRVGDREFGNVISTPVYRFQNNTDLVTNLPLGLIYDHAGAREFIDAGGHFHEDLDLPDWLTPLDPTVIRRFRQLLEGKATRPAVVPGFLADHAPINYSTLIWNIYDRVRPSNSDR